MSSKTLKKRGGGGGGVNPTTIKGKEGHLLENAYYIRIPFSFFKYAF